MWSLGDFAIRQRLQFLIFPEGIFYNKKNDECRTERINSIFELIYSSSIRYVKKKKGQLNDFIQLPLSVVRRGIEPLLPE
jgi:site-specific DNA recombinase